ncbi:SDR family oxidoreductase [Oceanicoccus sp. KOV_DT_Chl]|uniref:SDR family NAD(P)-dependent oxidoreductase n=1 Tax=Oceanicoccus sp. KOV_DT_Chl TaxID=1904639 RepID=UPI001F2EFFE0|nr:SDR family NAD(P)-dependent oxidoreductase [Oceanicoccus sp. KOV_DT_Chl]
MVTAETIWITGASTGIGRDLALLLAEQGNTVIASARSESGLQQLAALNANIIPLVFDVSRADAIDAVRSELLKHSPYLDRVILNAGTCEYLDISAPDWDMMQRVMTTNYFGAVNSLAVAMPLLQARPKSADGKGAHIIGVVSLATVVPFSRAQAYGASKAAMQYFLDSLRVDLQSRAIDVTVINPGFVKTPLTDKNDFSMPFLLSSSEAAQRMANAIAKRPRQYDFPGA